MAAALGEGCWTNAFTSSDNDVILRSKGCVYPQGSSIYYVLTGPEGEGGRPKSY